MISKILCLGTGKVGTLAAILLSEQFKVTAIDKYVPHAHHDLPFTALTGDVTDNIFMKATISKYDAVVCALPFFLNIAIARIAHQLGKHYFDLSEDVGSSGEIIELAKTSTAVMAPQCGLAPGLIVIIGATLAKEFDRLRSIKLRVGALPQHPDGALGYSVTWSATGLVNEYINDAEVIYNGKRKTVPSLQGKETINLEGAQYEAFYTSGGLGNMCDTFEGKVESLDYKTIRYPGHCDLMNFLLQELHLKDDRSRLEEILKNAKPPVKDDVVVVYTAVEGWVKNDLSRQEFSKSYTPKMINGMPWRAISWTTAASLYAVVEMVSKGWLPAKGFIKQEDISFEHFLKTKGGQYFI
ncbi:saccharopine dehydrogenase family protein [Pedobacter sp.]|uniref:saccharopine dehydrogenase family protein n=1 Tax=Pedobacter sp. TaxID=1411316 RepID=UPI003D7F3049